MFHSCNAIVRSSWLSFHQQITTMEKHDSVKSILTDKAQLEMHLNKYLKIYSMMNDIN